MVNAGASATLNCVIQSVAAGLILHVAIHEMITPNLDESGSLVGLMKFLVLCVGYGAMIMIAIWV